VTSERPGRGRVVLVATPIGNLGDLSPRAKDVLGSAGVVYCEDTRRTRALMSSAGLRAGHRLRSLHAHNEASRIPEVLGHLEAGTTVAVVTDAGMPGISDPGAQLVAAAIDAGFDVTVVPGPSAVLAALVVSGLPSERFCVEGFLPRKGSARRRRLAALLAEQRTSVVLESPRRLAATLAELAASAPDRPVAVGRELTKLHEEVWRGHLDGAATHFASREAKGEVVLVLGGAAAGTTRREVAAGASLTEDPRRVGGSGPSCDVAIDAALATHLAQGLSTREAADAVARAFGVSRRRAYEAALALRRSGTGR